MKNTISFNTKFGWVSATEINQKITRIQFNKTSKSGRFSKNLKNLKKMLNNYFKGKTNKINAPISLKGNNNQKKIWRELKKIQRGSTNTYGKIARKLKFSPRYVRSEFHSSRFIYGGPGHTHGPLIIQRSFSKSFWARMLLIIRVGRFAAIWCFTARQSLEEIKV